MSSPASVSGDERMRLFVAYTLAPGERERLSAWQRTELAGSRARLVPPEQLHFTVAFLGPRPKEEIEPITEVIASAASTAGPMPLELLRYRETRSVAMLVFDDTTGEATRVAEAIQRGLEEIGAYKREGRPWLPHVTVLRFRTPPRLRPELPELGPISPSEAAAYHSVLRRDGAQYDVLRSVALGGR
ncbi:MAG: RNA 2',3'-cyclic phosphodiesterase [Gaiellaceae bacterium]